MRAFWSPRYAGGGVDSTHFGKTYCNYSQFHFRATDSISYESWSLLLKFDTLLRLLRLKLRPREVAEVVMVQTKKKWSKILKSAIFELQTRYTPQKKAENNRHLDLKKNPRIFLWKVYFRSKKIIISYRSQVNFWKTCQDSKKITWDVYG